MNADAVQSRDGVVLRHQLIVSALFSLARRIDDRKLGAAAGAAAVAALAHADPPTATKSAALHGQL